MPSRIVSTSPAEHQLEWFWLTLMPGVAVKNVAILPYTLAGIVVICVALHYGAYDHKRKVAMLQLVFLFIHLLRQLRLVGTIIYRGRAPNISWCFILESSLRRY